MNRHAKAPSSGSIMRRGSRPAVIVVAFAALLASLVLGAALALAAGPPTVIHTFAQNVARTEATVNAEVDFGAASTGCRFEYGEDKSYGSELPCAIVDQAYKLTISANAGQFRLKRNGDTTVDLAFDATATQVKAALQALPSFASVESFTVSGGHDTETGLSTYEISFRSSLPFQRLTVEEGATPLSGGSGAALSGQPIVRADLSELEPDTTYHYRLIAANSEGSIPGEDRWLHTYGLSEAGSEGCPNEALRSAQHATFLPNCRAYEMVSPPDKNGGDVLRVSSRNQAAADGSAFVYSSLVGAGDAQGITLTTEYLAERTAAPGTNGWATHGITPRQPSFTFAAGIAGRDPNYEGDLSADLGTGVYRSFRPIDGVEGPNSEEVPNFYLRRDLRSPGPGTYTLLTEPFKWQPPDPVLPTYKPYFVSASADLSKVAFEAARELTADSAGLGQNRQKLYESEEGTLRLAGRVPPSGEAECDDASEAPACLPAESSMPFTLGAANYRYTPNMVSPDGSRVFFQSPAEGQEGNIYVREDGVRTRQLNVSEKTVKGPTAPATMFGASADGKRVLFVTAEGLVDGDEDGVRDLYMYDFDAAVGHHLTLVSADQEPAQEDEVIDLFGLSPDGSYIYFVAGGSLIAGEVGSARRLYLWHEGALSSVGEIAETGAAFWDLNGISAAGYGFAAGLKPARVSADGSLLFVVTSGAGFVGHGGYAGDDYGTCTFVDTNGTRCREELLYDPASDKLRCATCNPSGVPAQFDAWVNTQTGAASNASVNSHLSEALSDDGRYIFFNSQESLLPRDTNGAYDAYEYDSETEEVHLLSSGTSNIDSYFLDASDDGRDVFFVTRQRLVGWDIDTSYDVYDAKIGGGLPEPVATTAPCEGESCRGAVPAVPPVQAAASAGLHGPGNRKGACPKGSSRQRAKNGKTRCVKPRRHKTHKRNADNDRRAAK